ncbi:MAG: hypothetical protein U0793_01425 [Gemmataceae bacterium]
MRTAALILHLGLLTLLGLGASAWSAAGEKEKKDEPVKEKKAKNPLEGKKGTAIGLLVDKGKNYIEVRADGEEKGRRYVPEWKGGAPAAGGGLDKEILKAFDAIKVGSRVEVEWVFHERLRALSVKVLAPPKEKKDS